jgi:hypothetical protein
MVKKSKSKRPVKRTRSSETGADSKDGTPQADVPVPQESGRSGTLRVPHAFRPASTRFAAPDSKLSMTAAVVSKPSQSLIGAKTGVQLGPSRPLRVRIVR